MCQTMPDEIRTITVVPLSSSPQVVRGRPFERDQERFPKTHVGTEREGDGFSRQVILIEKGLKATAVPDCSFKV